MKLRSLGLPAALAAHALLLAGCATPAPPASGPPVVDALWPEGRATLPLAGLGDRVSLAPDEAFAVAELARDGATSHHVVAIRGAEVPHRHDRHDLLVVMLSGFGSMRLGDETRAVGEGSILYVPRGTPHAFSNHGDAPAIAYAVYLPAFDGSDRAPLDD